MNARRTAAATYAALYSAAKPTYLAGTTSPVTIAAATTGYAGMTLSLLQTYDAGVKNVVVGSVTSSTYCISSTVGGKEWWKNGPGADISNTGSPPC